MNPFKVEDILVTAKGDGHFKYTVTQVEGDYIWVNCLAPVWSPTKYHFSLFRLLEKAPEKERRKGMFNTGDIVYWFPNVKFEVLGRTGYNNYYYRLKNIKTGAEQVTDAGNNHKLRYYGKKETIVKKNKFEVGDIVTNGYREFLVVGLNGENVDVKSFPLGDTTYNNQPTGHLSFVRKHNPGGFTSADIQGKTIESLVIEKNRVTLNLSGGLKMEAEPKLGDNSLLFVGVTGEKEVEVVVKEKKKVTSELVA